MFDGVSGEVSLTAAGGLRKLPGLNDIFESPALVSFLLTIVFFFFFLLIYINTMNIWTGKQIKHLSTGKQLAFCCPQGSRI